jgi:transposase-like protein
MWLYAMNLVMVAKKGISGCQLQRELGMKSYKGAWRMLHLIREIMGKEEYKDTFEAIVEIDETYVGGKPRKENVHNERETNEKFNKRGRGSSKTPVIGVKERSSGRVHCVVANANENGQQLTGKQLLKVLDNVCKRGTKVMTDQYSGYNIINEGREENTKEFIRIMVNHDICYSLGDGIHTNGIESFWAIVKRGVFGIYHHISVRHLQSYMDEFSFRMNHRKIDDGFESLVGLSIAA